MGIPIPIIKPHGYGIETFLQYLVKSKISPKMIVLALFFSSFSCLPMILFQSLPTYLPYLLTGFSINGPLYSISRGQLKQCNFFEHNLDGESFFK